MPSPTIQLADWINEPGALEPRFIEGDCREVMGAFPDASFDLIATSPPYPRAQRKPTDLGRYRRSTAEWREGLKERVHSTRAGRRVTSHAIRDHTASPAKHTHGRPNVKGETGLAMQLHPDAWWAWFAPIGAEMFRVLKPQRSLLLVLGPVTSPSWHRHTYIHEAVLRMEELGWSLCQEIIWRKPNGIPVNAEGCMQDVTERILWFVKGRGKPIWYPGEIADIPKQATVRRPIVRNVWTIPVGQTRYPPAQVHFAAYPLRLIERIIHGWTQAGDLVLDPFMGSGTTAIAASKLGRRWVGIELNPEGEIECARARWAMEFADHPIGVTVG